MLINKKILMYFSVFIPMFGYMVLGSVGGYYAYFLLLLLLFLYYGGKKIILDNVSLSIIIIVFIAIIVGCINTLLGVNDFKNFFIYSLMGISYIFAIFSGKFFSENIGKGLELLAILGVAELLLIIPRIFIVGLDIRTSLGFTYLLPCIFFMLKFNRIGFLFFCVVSLFYFMAIFLSGLRSVLIPGIFIYLLSLIYFYKTYSYLEDKKQFNKLLFIFPLIFLAFISLSLNLFGLKDRFYHATNVVVVRMEQTLLNPDGARLDPKDGRQEESEYALEAFEKEADLINYLIGMGYGISYQDHSKDGDLSAHVHITPIAYFIRHGYLGVILYLIIFYGIFKSLIDRKSFNLSIKAALLVWVLSSAFAGVIIMPVFWFFWSFLYYSRFKAN